MEVVTATPASSNGVPPFHDHDVREWSRIDSLTGVLERARLETDRWAANTNNSCHKYGKVVDSRARSDADGGLQQQARRQLEVFQSQIPGGHLQVIKTHTVSSSRWTNKSTSSNNNSVFENLQLSLNPLDLSSQKSKATVGRSVSRRPPSRQRLRNEPSSNVTNPLTNNAHLTAATNLHRVSRLCHQIHDSAVKQAFGRQSPSSTSRPPIQERQNGDGSVDVCEFECITNNNNTKLNGHTNLLRTKSTSSEDIHLLTPEKDATTKSIEDLEDLEQLQNWRRTSKIRRSLQFPKQQTTTTITKPIDLPENSVSVRKIREDLEKGRRLSTALRGNTVDLQALDQILQSISSSSSILSDKTPDDNLDDSENEQLITTNNNKQYQKRNSFVTVESLQEVRGRLRRTSSPTINLYNIDKEKEVDDGIVTEDTNSSLVDMPEKSNQQSRVRSYVYGMEAMLSKKNIGTNSLESRTKLVNGNSTNRSEDWYNRRKSYGFEQVHGHQETTNSLKDKSMVESSTDSGICKSTEIVVIPSTTTTRTNETYNNYNSDNGSDTEKLNGNDDVPHGNVKKIATIFAQDENNGFNDKKFSLPEWKRSPLKSTTITIPIARNNNNIVDLSWNDEPVKEIKRHSIAVDESKYVLKNDDNKYRRTSLAINDSFNKNNNYSQENDDDSLAQNRKTKKVEFCKTEVHFAADSGKVNIVETDEKPPPTHNFRRRRRNSGPINSLSDFNKNGLPMLHFGDTSYEKSMFSLNDDEYIDENKSENHNSNVLYENVQPKSSFGIVTVNTNTHINNNVIDHEENERKDQLDIENIKGILKNKPIKPKPYHLGEQTLLNDVNNSDEDMNKWGVRLRHVSKEETPIWKSTVTVHNTYNKSNNDIKGYNSSTDDDQPEFQKLLKNLRPTRKLDIVSDSEHRYSDSFSNIRVLSPVKDNRRSSWSVSDKVDNQNGENIRGYSTKVNFGNGEATVIENDSYFEKDRLPTWPRTENSAKESKQLLNKGLVVRIGCEDSASNHTLCSKMTTTQDTNNATTTTTTKITIDLSPPSQELIDNNNSVPAAFASYTKYERSQNHSFKSTSLILNTIKNNNTHTNSDTITKKQTNYNTKNETINKVPQQLEALKKLYEDVQSDSDADKEVQLLMSKITETDLNRIDNDNSSIVSGSWSKMRSYKTVNETVNSRKNTNEIQSRLDLTANTKVGKDKSDDRLKLVEDSYNNNAKYAINATKHQFSPVVLRKTTPTTVVNRTEFKIADKLSSPFLVGKNLTNNSDELLTPNGHTSPVNEFKNITDTKLQIKHNTSDIVLRQPKKSEMTYFGVKVSPRPFRKLTQAVKENGLTDKPDLLQHYTRKPTTSSPKLNAKPRKKSPVSAKTPIYENLRPTTNKYKSKEFDSSILDELTKAADQIMQAVNGYTDEDSHNRFSTDDEENKIKKPLATISETKSWKQDKMQNDVKKTKQFNNNNTKTKLKHTSSNSSIESFSKEKRTTTPEIKSNSMKTINRRKTNELTKATTKARRLQRASSREALLQSHGSSSEDLSINIETPVRKPRLVKKTKVAQLTMTNGLELSKKPSVTPSRKKKEESAIVPAKMEERISGVLPEIRHKTAVSTIRSTAEKNSRERAKQKIEEARKKAAQKRESNNRGVSSTRISEKNRNAVTNKETVTHRISTANIKKCHRAETGGPK